MKYENARDILPARLLEEIQKYAEGKLIYIPRTEKNKAWGDSSGYRNRLDKRNALIRSRYSAGQSVLEIAEEFYLSPETIKKLVYGKKVDLPVFSPSVESAAQYADAGLGEEWVQSYLHTLQQSMPEITDYFMSELVRIPLRLIGTEEKQQASGQPAGCPEVPLIVLYSSDTFSVPFQPDYLAILRKEHRNAHYAFIFAGNADYEHFWNKYGKHFRR